jgi:hypothetical protein
LALGDYGAQYIAGQNLISINPQYGINRLYLHNTLTDYDTNAFIYTDGNLVGSRGPLTAAATSRYLPSNNYRSATITFSRINTTHPANPPTAPT